MSVHSDQSEIAQQIEMPATLEFFLLRDAGWVRARAEIAAQAIERLLEHGGLTPEMASHCMTALDAIEEIQALSKR